MRLTSGQVEQERMAAMKRWIFSLWTCSLLLSFAQSSSGLRFVNLSSFAESIDFYLSNVPTPLIRKVGPLQATGLRTEFPPATYHFQVRLTGDSTGPILAETVLEVQDGHWYSICYFSDSTNAGILVLDWDLQKPQLTNLKLRFINFGSHNPITVTLRGNPFVLGLNYQEISEFVEVPLLQAETVGILDAATGALLSEFATPFEGNNVYAVFFVKRGIDWYAIWLNESQQDEQVPLTELRKKTYRIPGRLLNFGKDFGVELRHTAAGSPLLTAANMMGSAREVITINADSTLYLYRTGSSGQPLAEYYGFTALPYTDYWFISIPLNAKWHLFPIPFELSTIGSNTLALRLVNLHPELAAVDFVIATVADTLRQDSIAQFAYSSWIWLTPQDYHLLVFDRTTHTKLLDIALSTADLAPGPHTLYLTTDAQGTTQLYYLAEETGTAATPLQVLKAATPTVNASFRFVNLTHYSEPLLPVVNQTPLTTPTPSEYASPVVTPLPQSTLSIAFQPSGIDTTLHQLELSAESEKRYLAVLWGLDSLKSILAIAPSKIGDGQQLAVRFIHCNDQLPEELDIQLADNKTLTVPYKTASDFLLLSSLTPVLEFTIHYKNQQWQCQADLFPAYTVYTVLLTASADGQLIGFLFPEERTEATPLTPININAVSGVFAGQSSSQLVSVHPTADGLFLSVHLPPTTQWRVQLFTLLGKRIWQSRGQGSQQLMVPIDRWTSGLYWLVLRDTRGQQWSFPIGW